MIVLVALAGVSGWALFEFRRDPTKDSFLAAFIVANVGLMFHCIELSMAHNFFLVVGMWLGSIFLFPVGYSAYMIYVRIENWFKRIYYRIRIWMCRE
ncbi:MAG: hypothetical protein ABIA92_00505 [Patescibacteria group bacterium]